MRKSARGIILAFLIAATGVMTPLAAGTILLGTIGQGGTPSTLVELDPGTGALIRTIGEIGYAVNGLTYDATTGTLYGSTRPSGEHFGLIAINMTTGAGSPIGTGWGISVDAITSIATDSAGRMFGWAELMDTLAAIDKVQGTAELLPVPNLSTAAYGLAFDNSDTLYLVNPSWSTGGLEIYAIDTSTGDATFVGNLPNASFAHHGDFHPLSNLYYGIDSSFGTNPRQLVIADLGDGSSSTLPTVDDLHTLTFVGTPEPAALFLAGFGLVALGAFRRRRA